MEDGEGNHFQPVLIPIEYCPDVQKEYKNIRQVVDRKINTDAFGGVYPIQVGLDGILKSVKRSFPHGVLCFIDYTSFERGQHNWNKAVNIFQNYRFGTEDLDFQIDDEEVSVRSERLGFRYSDDSMDLKTYLDQMIKMVGVFSERDYRRFAQAFDKPFDDRAQEMCALSYSFVIATLAEAYEVMIMTF